MIDVMKLNMRNIKGYPEEWVILGFIERPSGRMRGILMPNLKVQTIC